MVLKTASLVGGEVRLPSNSVPLLLGPHTLTGKALPVRHDGLIARSMFCLKDFPREVYRGSTSPEFVQAAGGRVTGDGQQPV